MSNLVKILSSGLIWRQSAAKCYSSVAPNIQFSEEVLNAKMENKPIVALESTIITHGMPYPQNLDTALEVERIVRENGATPATIAILKGRLTVGVTEKQLQYLAETKGVKKASRRDMAPIIATRGDGATTVAGTIVAADIAGIPVFVTGGIGGVHRGGEISLDISADLNELGRNRILVVCSGVKSILDIGRTLEYLETQGVCVCSFGDSADFPAFYTLKSGHQAPYHVRDADHAAQLLYAAKTLQLESGIVVAVPVPEQYAIEETIIENAIQHALDEANKKCIHGKDVTPFLLASVASATGGASLATNIALIKNNAKVGAQIAVQFIELNNKDHSEHSKIGFLEASEKFSNNRREFHTSSYILGQLKDKFDFPMINKKDIDNDVLVIGGANIDRTYRITEQKIQFELGASVAAAVESHASSDSGPATGAAAHIRSGGSVRHRGLILEPGRRERAPAPPEQPLEITGDKNVTLI